MQLHTGFKIKYFFSSNLNHRKFGQNDNLKALSIQFNVVLDF